MKKKVGGFMNKIKFMMIFVTFFAIILFTTYKTSYLIENNSYLASKSEVEKFINDMAPIAQQEMKESGIYASFIIAQAALESGWGKDSTPKYNNYFGVKRGTANDSCTNVGERSQGKGNGIWDGTSICLKASEGGNAYFRVYNSINESVKDHSQKFWCNSRYKDIISSTTLDGQLRAVAYSGYANDGTTPQGVFNEGYYNKLVKIINDYNLTKYDAGISYDGTRPDYADSCGTSSNGTAFTGESQGYIGYTSNYKYLNLNTGYTGDITQGYIYKTYSPTPLWEELLEDDDESKVNHIIGNIFLQGEKLYGDGVLHFDGLVTDGTTNSAPIGWSENMGNPLSCLTAVTSGFGSQEAFRNSSHKGLDLASPVGTPIYTVTDGIVVGATGGCASYGSLTSTCGGSYGNHVMIKAADGTIYIYAHMFTTPLVSKGETVISGQQIGVVGSSGRSTGPHLHFEVKVNNVSVNPENYVNANSIPKC